MKKLKKLKEMCKMELNETEKKILREAEKIYRKEAYDAERQKFYTQKCYLKKILKEGKHPELVKEADLTGLTQKLFGGK
jgi:hypothetical protein